MPKLDGPYIPAAKDLMTNRGPAGLIIKLPSGLHAEAEKVREERQAVEAARPIRIDYIVPELQPFVVDIDIPQYDPLNARLHPEKNLEAIKQSLTEYGQRSAIVCRQDNSITVKGNGTLQAARELGWTKIAAMFQDFTDVEAMGFGLADNRTSELARWDIETVAQLEKMIREAGGVTPGWTDEELTVLRRIADEKDKPSSGISRTAMTVYPLDTIVETAFQWFRANGLPYPNLPLHVCMQTINELANMPNEALVNSVAGLGVANTYHPHRYEAKADGMRSVYELFHDDDGLRTAIRKQLELGGRLKDKYFGMLNMTEGTQSCSNFRPAFALLMYRRFAPADAVVLDTSTGYGGRLVGFMASGRKRYIGIDPNPKTWMANSTMAAALGFADRVELECLPAEDVPYTRIGEGWCDFAFTSPPYFAKEQYTDDDTQSWVRYKTGDEWRLGFLQKMLALQYAVLKPGSYNVVNIAPVTLKGVTYRLDEWTINLAKKLGFKHEGTEEYPLKRRLGANNDGSATATEPVLIFRRP